MSRLILTIVTLLALIEPASARQCGAYVDREGLAVDSAVFVGRVSSVAEYRWGWLSFAVNRFKVWMRLSTEVKSPPTQRVTFEVETSWKGVSSNTVDVDIYDHAFLRVGRDYMVYAYGPVDRLSTDVCTRTHEFFGQVDQEFASASPLVLTTGTSDVVSKSLVPIGIIVAFVLFLAFWDLRRRRSRDGGSNSR
jgi:hypothetical protein